MRVAPINSRECLRKGQKWSCTVACPPACKRSSYRRSVDLLAQSLEVSAIANASAVLAATDLHLCVNGSLILSDEIGLPLVWPRGGGR